MLLSEEVRAESMFKKGHFSHGRKVPLSHRKLRVEPLEERHLLSANWPGLLVHDASGDLFTVDMNNNWAVQRVGTTSVPFFDMAFSASGQLFGVGGSIGGPSRLYEIIVNFSNNSVSTRLIGTITLGGAGIYVNSLEFAPDGSLLAAGYDSSGGNALFRINPSTAGAERLVRLGIHRSAGDLEFDEFGNLFLTTEGAQLIRIDVAGESYQVVGSIIYSDFYGLSYGPGPVLYAYRQTGDVYRINRSNGQITYITTLSHSDLAFVYGAAIVFPAPTNLGTLDFANLTLEATVLGQRWYRVEATREGLLTTDVYRTRSGTDVAYWELLGDGSMRRLFKTGPRADHTVPSAGSVYYIQIDDASATIDLRLANLVRFVGNGALIYGTNQDDQFSIRPGSVYEMTINGVVYLREFDSRQLVQVNFDGLVGNDRATFSGTAYNETATLNLLNGTGEVRSPDRYVVQATGVAHMSFAGGGGLDTAILTGSGGNDSVVLRFREATLTGFRTSLNVSAVKTIQLNAAGGTDTVQFTGTNGDDLVTLGPSQGIFTDSGGTFLIEVTNAESFSADAGIGFNQLTLFDGPGADVLEVRADSVTFLGPNVNISAANFQYVDATATPGENNSAKLYGKGGVIDQFVARPREGSLVGGGLTKLVRGFDRIEGFGNSYENDQATIEGTAGVADTLTATRHYTTLTGRGFYLRAASIRQVTVQGESIDHARLYDGPAADLFQASGTTARMVYDGDANIFTEVRGFGQITAYATTANGGVDRAQLTGLTGVVDTLNARPRQTTLFGTGYRIWLVELEQIHTVAQPGEADIAYLIDSTGNDTFEYYPTPTGSEQKTVLRGTGLDGFSFANSVEGFGRVYSYSTTGGFDVAYLYDASTGSDVFTATPNYAVMSGPGHYSRAWGFEQVYGYAGNDGFTNSARLYDSADGDVFEARATYSQIMYGGNPAFRVRVSGFRYSTAYGSGGHDRAYFYGTFGVRDTFTANLQTRTALISNSSRYDRAQAFDAIYAYGDPLEGEDSAYVTDSSGNDHLAANGAVNQILATVRSVDQVIELWDFRYVRAESALGGTDTRAVYHRELLAFILDDVGPWVDE